jgi:hypothetical protein
MSQQAAAAASAVLRVGAVGGGSGQDWTSPLAAHMRPPTAMDKLHFRLRQDASAAIASTA